MRKILPLGEPLINGYHFHAYRFSIMSLHPDYTEWLQTSYIQLMCRKEVPGFDVHFLEMHHHYFPLLHENYLRKSAIHRYAPVLEFLIDSLDEDKYIVTFVDEFDIPDRVAYQTTHHIHDIMVYGYDSDRQVFHVIGYRADRSYGPSEVPFEQFVQAYLGQETEKGNMQKWANGIHLFHLKTDWDYHYKRHMFLEMAEDYLYSRNTFDRLFAFQHRIHFAYGMEVYECLLEYLEYLKHHNAGPIDVRVFHTLYEHKRCMVVRLADFASKGYLSKPYDHPYRELEEQALQLRNLCLKYELTSNRNVLEQMAGLLVSIRETEKGLLQEIVEDFRRLFRLSEGEAALSQ